MAFVMMALFVVSCSSDSDGDGTGGGSSTDVIVGNWKYVGDIDEDGYEAAENEPCDDEFLKFSSNGTVKVTFKYCGEPTEVYTYGWEKATEANHYIIDNNEGSTEDVKITFSDDKKEMTLYEYEDESGFYGVVYKRQ